MGLGLELGVVIIVLGGGGGGREELEHGKRTTGGLGLGERTTGD